jgi:hypothetical protein
MFFVVFATFFKEGGGVKICAGFLFLIGFFCASALVALGMSDAGAVGAQRFFPINEYPLTGLGAYVFIGAIGVGAVLVGWLLVDPVGEE